MRAEVFECEIITSELCYTNFEIRKLENPDLLILKQVREFITIVDPDLFQINYLADSLLPE